MKIRAFDALTATLGRDSTDCLILADALACATTTCPRRGCWRTSGGSGGRSSTGARPAPAWTSARRSARTFWPWPGLPISEVQASLCYAAAHE